MIRDHYNRHALDEKLRGAPRPPGANHLAIGHRQAMAMVLATAGEEDAVERLLSSVTEFAVRFSAPGEWLVISENDTPEGLQRCLDALCSGRAHILDQSEARVLFRLSGPSTRRILAKGIGLDLHPIAFAAGASANALCGHIAVNLVRTGEDVFELLAPRSFAESLFDDLMTMGREYDLTAAFAA
ncbi:MULTISPECIES: sarcosine oxidase subunit gamma family protein [unclassified Sinorhizobium]|uniref:sarcosine oxidase subunit gamma n=1 Tax=unclassified Sinorhizobium TaxID=2613772 RepID=UPI0024C2B3DD|nr:MULTISPECIES: sarcosine oxidase subunit gamma family protein [unclassified Sinorhizobium]MDK1378490.1 sarcosine oxidase subunit gamma family protein [Sinorhizobium sp. 6-70]MDK1482666.1 sarcosine oxidase subunit gamma family protein [Sinorhizobium sp. 6-117]